MKTESPLAKLLFSVIRMEVTAPNYSGVGTAFVFSQNWKEGHAPFLVTAAHTVENAQHGRLFFTRSKEDKPVVGEYVCLELDEFGKGWKKHPRPELDLAVLPLAPLVAQMQEKGSTVYNTALDESLLPGPAPDTGVDAVEEVMVAGFSAEIQDRLHLFPLVQKGVTANPFDVDFAKAPKFLVQLPICSGLAGSPVLVTRTFHQPTPQGLATATQIVLLGMLTDVAVRQERSAAVFGPIPPLPAPGRADATWFPVGLAVKSSAISEVIGEFLKSIEAVQAPEPASK
ncbi:MAG: hypothetical protein HYY17_02645 [Planctomycetes bacterium]|nr:hypothetical protein [Planctomycetota bacterium]